MSKKYLAIISTDHHLSEGNASTIKDILLEEMEIADKRVLKLISGWVMFLTTGYPKGRCAFLRFTKYWKRITKTDIK